MITLRKNSVLILLTTIVIILLFPISVKGDLTKVDLSAYTGVKGDVITVSGGEGEVVSGATVEVYWDIYAGPGAFLLNATTGKMDGSWECQITVPDAVNGVHYVWAQELSTLSEASSTFQVLPLIDVSPSRGLPGDIVAINGYGFSGNEEVVINFSDIVVKWIDADELGSFETTFMVPAKPYGVYDVNATDESDHSALTTFTVGPCIALDAYAGPVGAVRTVFGRGFTPSGTVDSIVMSGIPCTAIDPVGIDAVGRFTIRVVIPSVSSVGWHAINVTDSGDLYATDDFYVTGLPTIIVTPNYGVPGATVNIEGHHFTALTGEDVSLELWDETGTTWLNDIKEFETDSNGEFSGTFTVPAQPYDFYTLKADQAAFSIFATDEFYMNLFLLIPSLSSGPTGSNVTLSGSGFTTYGEWNATIGDIPIFSDEIVDEDGLISGSFIVPSLELGVQDITVLDVETEIEVTAEFTVTDVTRIELDPNRGLPGDTINIHGYNFAHIANEEAEVELWGPRDEDVQIAVLDVYTTDSNGEFSGTFVVPDVDHHAYTIIALQNEYSTETRAGFRIREPLSAWATVIPTIDGQFSPGEWDDAYVLNSMSPWGDIERVYVKNDANNLYVATMIEDDELSIGPDYDAVILYFDNDNDHNWEYHEPGDEVFGWTGEGGEGYIDGWTDTTAGWFDDESVGGTKDGTGAASNDGTFNYFEFSHPLDSIDDDHDFSLSLGEDVGIAQKYVKNGATQWWKPHSNPAFWGDILISDPPIAFETESSWLRNPVVLDGRISSPDEWSEAITHTIPLDRVWGWPDRQVEPSDRVLEAKFKNDNEWLYCLYKFELEPEEEINGALIELFTWYDDPPDYYSDLGGVRVDNSTIDLYGWTGSDWELDTDLVPPGDNNTEGAAYFDGTHHWFEIRKRLDSGDGYDWHLTTGELVGEPSDPEKDEHLLVAIWDNSPRHNFEHRISMQLAGPRPSPEGMVSWWTGDGNTFDLVGPNHGVGKNGVTYETGMVDGAFSFDGFDDFIYAPGTNIDGLQQLTIEAWVKLNSMPGRQERFVTLLGEKAVLRYDGENNPGGRQLHFYMFFEEPIIQRHIRVNDILQLDVFHHVAGTYDGDYMRLYLDGVELDSRAVSGTVIQGDGVVLSSSVEALDGLLDEVCIYNRALTAAEIQSIYEAGHYGKYKSLPQSALAKPADKGQPDEGAAPEYLNYSIPLDTPVPVQAVWEPNLDEDERFDLVLGKPIAVLVNVSDMINDVYVEVEFDGQLLGGYKYSNDLHPIIVLSPFIPNSIGYKTFTLRYDGNVISETFVDIKETYPLNVSYHYLERFGSKQYGTIDQTNYNTMVDYSTMFLNATYPVANVKVNRTYAKAGLPGHEKDTINLEYGIYLDVVDAIWEAKTWLESSAIGVAIGPNNPKPSKGYFDYHGIGGAAGICFGPSTKGLAVLDGYYSGTAHEIGHIYNLYYGPGVDEMYDEVPPFGKRVSGFWVADNSWRSGYCFMGVGNYRDLDQTWVHNETYEDLFNTLQNPSGGSPILLANGVIFEDGSIERSLPYYEVQGSADMLKPGDYALVFRDVENVILREVSFDAPFYVYVEPSIGHSGYSAEFGWRETNFATFAFGTEYPPETDKVQIINKKDPQNPIVLDVVDASDIHPPILDSNGPYTTGEGSPLSFDASGVIVLENLLQYRWDFEDDGTWDTDWLTSPTISHTWYDDWRGTAIVEVTDGELFERARTTTINILNVDPTVSAIVAPLEPVQAGSPITASADFTDLGTLDTHTAVWDWGDGTTPGTVVESLGSGLVTDTHTYTTPGVYTISLTVTDDDGGSGISMYQYVVVYEPDGGFVTGGGWIDSPPGTYTPDPDLAGKANFGFVSKYKKGATAPVGKTEFVFHVADLHFHSNSYQWLVIAGPKAKFKGTGTINHEGSYGFMLTATDGHINGGGGVDKFRIKIWDIATDSIIYDNQMGDSDDADATTDLGGGSIVIHKPKK